MKNVRNNCTLQSWQLITGKTCKTHNHGTLHVCICFVPAHQDKCSTSISWSISVCHKNTLYGKEIYNQKLNKAYMAVAQFN